ncbi:MAG TPA: type II toxin-antitoxin system VapC family toxin [Solirubrobacteraceae bacterium]|nr:type II toxin-antitoxin system VapC family toxin [Solirubrobacteraceae bacterium]
MSAERRLLYADSSALVKLVVDERESAALEAHLAAQPTVLVTSRLATVEVARAAKLANPAAEVQEDVERLLSSCTLVAVSAQLLRASRELTSAKVRTLDAIHLATALHVEADELLAYDHRLLAAATAQGLAVLAPSPA